MNYSETIDWLFAQLPMYQRIGAAAYKVDLSNTLKLTNYLNEPQDSFKSVHVAGTNGKGSTSHMLASILQEAGCKVGLYTSPHLKDFRERIKISGTMIPKEDVVDFVEKHQSFFEENQLSFFEMTVGLAFDYFRKEKVDVAVIEVGLGGRLDSTNIITPEVSVITNIGLDHTRFLGETLKEIASEKAGIIKTNIPVVIGETTSETKIVFSRKALKEKSQIIFTEEENLSDYKSDLLGDYQKKNIQTTVETIKELQNKGWEISEENIKEGFLKVVKNTGLQGRWQVLKEHPKVICDTAHNREGLLIVMQQLKKEHYKRLHIVLGMVDDKNLKTVLPLFPKEAHYYFCKPEVIRGMGALVLQKSAEDFGLVGEVYSSVNEAYNASLKNASTEDVIYIGGSTFVVAEVL